jgi:hypothetical protein
MMIDVDLFSLYRRLLIIACGIYGLFSITQAAIALIGRLFGASRETALLRRYVLVQLLRVRVVRYWRQLLVIATLIASLAVVAWLHKYFGFTA